MRWILMTAIKLYRLGVTPVVGPSCRFYPTCSAYALEAIDSHGVWRGGRLALWRIARCHPWHSGGFDPVPSRSADHHG